MTREDLKKFINRQIKKNELLKSWVEVTHKLNAELVDLRAEIERLKDKEEIIEIEEDFSFPEKVESVQELKQFINRAFGVHYIKKNFTPRRLACAAIRDSLALRYDNIERLNDQQNKHGYMAGDEHHQDAVYVYINGIWYIIDFCIASKEDGPLENNLCWNIILETPWENKHE